MSRPINVELKDRLANYIQRHCLASENGVFTCTLEQFVADLNVTSGDPKNQINRLLTMLENGGTISITKYGRGSIPNDYRYLRGDKKPTKITPAEFKCDDIIDAAEKVAGDLYSTSPETALETLQNITSYARSCKKAEADLISELEQLKSAIRSLKIVIDNGVTYYTTRQGSVISLINEVMG